MASQMQNALVDYGKEEKARLSETMPHRVITVAEDETFLSAGICLVAIEAVSGFVLVEEYAETREAETWSAHLDEATVGLDVEVVQFTADEARALARHAADQGAHHSPDLFHVANEINRAFALPLLRRQRDAERSLDKARLRLEKHHRDRDAYWAEPRSPGRPPDYARRIGEAEAACTLAKQALEGILAHQATWREVARDLGRVYHPFELDTGEPRTPEALAATLQSQFDKLQHVAREVSLSAGSRSSLDKAARVVPKMVDTLRFFHDTVQQQVERLELAEEYETLLRSRLIPAAYLSRVIGRTSDAERHATLTKSLGHLLAEMQPVPTLSAGERAMLEQAAFGCADLFQRASSCVEGRNGRLSQWEHAQRRLSPNKLKGLTVIHNYFIRRPAGTTAAERFFGSKPRDLLDWLVERISPPARPAARRRNPLMVSLFQPA